MNVAVSSLVHRWRTSLRYNVIIHVLKIPKFGLSGRILKPQYNSHPMLLTATFTVYLPAITETKCDHLIGREQPAGTACQSNTRAQTPNNTAILLVTFLIASTNAEVRRLCDVILTK